MNSHSNEHLYWANCEPGTMVMVRGDKAPVKAGRIMFNNGDWIMRVPPFFTEVRLVNLRDIVWVWPPNV